MSNNDIAVLANDYIMAGLKGGIVLSVKQAFQMARDFYTEVSLPAPYAADRLNEEMKSLVAQGKWIQAIKLYREKTGAELKEAKEIVNYMRNA